NGSTTFMIGRVYWITETETCLCLASVLFI
ncbi:uncharacterized protein METZ01_LOCUS226387, partial [marine metagenome]